MTDLMVPTTTDTEQPVMRAPAQLEHGDWIAAEQIKNDLDGTTEVFDPVEVLSVHTASSATHIPGTLVVYRTTGGDLDSARLRPSHPPLRLLNDAEITDAEDQAKKAVFVASLRRLASWFEDHPWVPIPYSIRLQKDFHGPDAVAQVMDLGRRLGLPVDQSLDDRTEVAVKLDGSEIDLIAWHKDGRPGTKPELVGPREVDNGDQPAVIPDGVDGQPIGKHPARRSPRLP